MGRLTRWGVDHRGFKIVPARLGRGYVKRSDQRCAMQRLEISCEIPEPTTDLPFGMEPLLFRGPNLEPQWPEPELPPIDDAGDPDPDLEDDGEPLTEQLRAVRLPRDLSRFIAAHRAKAPPARPIVRKLEPAPSREECRRCGIPGWKGCDHQLPFVAIDPATLKALGC